MLKETELQDAIGKKMPNLVKPRNEALVHPEEDLIEAYTTEFSRKFEAQIGQQTTQKPPYIADHTPRKTHPPPWRPYMPKLQKRSKMDTLRECGLGILMVTPK